MKKGGYQILNLKNSALTSGSEANISGTYTALSGANGKRVIVSGLYVGDTAYSDFECYFEYGSNEYEGAATIGSHTITIVVADGDDVTVTVA